MSPELARELRSRLLAWFDAGHRDLPWRHTTDPYAVWVSEVMLQQTRVDTVIPYYEEFLRRLPTVGALAEAPSEAVMKLWDGLGYYRRARMLHDGARQIVRDRAGQFPRDATDLRTVRGVGRYTAGAIASIAWGQRAPLVDGNVARVLARLFAVPDDVRSGAGGRRLWALAEDLVPDDRPGDWNQALMELGAVVCTPRSPACDACPVAPRCTARATGAQASLPRVAPRKRPALTLQVSLVASSSRGIVLARRRPDGPFGGLWEPPTLPDPEPSPAASAFEALLGLRLRACAEAGRVTHVLSHRRLETRVFCADVAPRGRPRLRETDVYDSVEIVPWSEYAGRPMSTFARKAIACGGESGRPESHFICALRPARSS